MSLSVLINTCAQDTALSRFATRIYAMRTFILPAYCGDAGIAEVIVSGVWEPGEGYTYVPVLGQHNNIFDAARQRQAALEVATGDFLVFQADDHLCDRTILDAPQLMDDRGLDVLVPMRLTRMRGRIEYLNNGEPGCDLAQWNGYVLWHGAIYRRSALVACPWDTIPMPQQTPDQVARGFYSLDVAHTAQLRAAGQCIDWSTKVHLWDVEFGGQPWL